MTNVVATGLAATIALSVAGCAPRNHPAASDRSPTTLTIGFGSTTGTQTRQVVENITAETLVSLGTDGRPMPMLAESWTVSDDGLTWRFTLRPHVVFHDGTPLTAAVTRDAIVRVLPQMLGTSYKDIASIEAASPTELVFRLHERLTYLPETLAIAIHPADSPVGTGPFYRAPAPTDGKAGTPAAVELLANKSYHGGKPLIDRIVIEPYASVRAAWADMLRTNVDMLYEVGSDAFELVRPARNTKLVTFHRPYALLILLNVRHPALKDPAVRRALNSAINRDEIVTVGMNGHGRPADGPVWPDFWANSDRRPHFQYQPAPVTSNGKRVAFTLLFSDPTHERVALLVQRQLQAVGVDVKLEQTSVPDGQARASSGKFDAWLADMGLGPTFFRTMIFWQSGSPYFGTGYANQDVDSTSMQIRRARNDDEFKAGVSAFQQAIANDPPAIFLAWNEGARAVSTRFLLPTDPGRDILKTMWQWRAASDARPSQN